MGKIDPVHKPDVCDIHKGRPGVGCAGSSPEGRLPVCLPKGPPRNALSVMCVCVCFFSPHFVSLFLQNPRIYFFGGEKEVYKISLMAKMHVEQYVA